MTEQSQGEAGPTCASCGAPYAPGNTHMQMVLSEPGRKIYNVGREGCSPAGEETGPNTSVVCRRPAAGQVRYAAGKLRDAILGMEHGRRYVTLLAVAASLDLTADQLDPRDAEVARLRAQVAAARAFAVEMRGYCSPHGISALYADRLDERLDAAAARLVVQPDADGSGR